MSQILNPNDLKDAVFSQEKICGYDVISNSSLIDYINPLTNNATILIPHLDEGEYYDRMTKNDWDNIFPNIIVDLQSLPNNLYQTVVNKNGETLDFYYDRYYKNTLLNPANSGAGEYNYHDSFMILDNDDPSHTQVFMPYEATQSNSDPLEEETPINNPDPSELDSAIILDAFRPIDNDDPMYDYADAYVNKTSNYITATERFIDGDYNNIIAYQYIQISINQLNSLPEKIVDLQYGLQSPGIYEPVYYIYQLDPTVQYVSNNLKYYRYSFYHVYYGNRDLGLDLINNNTNTNTNTNTPIHTPDNTPENIPDNTPDNTPRKPKDLGEDITMDIYYITDKLNEDLEIVHQDVKHKAESLLSNMKIIYKDKDQKYKKAYVEIQDKLSRTIIDKQNDTIMDLIDQVNALKHKFNMLIDNVDCIDNDVWNITAKFEVNKKYLQDPLYHFFNNWKYEYNTPEYDLWQVKINELKLSKKQNKPATVVRSRTWNKVQILNLNIENELLVVTFQCKLWSDTIDSESYIDNNSVPENYEFYITCPESLDDIEKETSLSCTQKIKSLDNIEKLKIEKKVLPEETEDN